MSDLPQRIVDGLAALRAGRPADAVAALRPVADDPELAAAADLQDVRARVLSLLAQALLASGRPAEAEAPCRASIRLLRQLSDRAGLTEVRALQDEIVKALAHDAEQQARLAEQARVASTPLDALLAEAPTPSARADVLLRKAQAHADLDQLDAAAPLAEEALDLAVRLDDVRLEVLARVALARASTARASEQLVLAYRRAERADEFNLVSLVARAASLTAVALPVELGPHAPPEER